MSHLVLCNLRASRQLFRDQMPLADTFSVRSHGTSSSQDWRKRIVVQQSELDP